MNQFLEANQFIKAESKKVSITKQRFASLTANEGIHRNASAFRLLRNEEIKEQSYYVIDRKYDDELGLQVDIEEKINDLNIWD